MRVVKKLSCMLLAIAMLLSIFAVSFTANAESQAMSPEFSEFLTDGKLVLNYAKPESKDSETAMLIAENFYDITGNLWFDFEGMPDDMSKVNLHYDMSQETHVVDVVWNYNEEVLNAAHELMNSFSAKAYYLTDLEFINFLIKRPDVEAEYGEGMEVANFCGEVKEILGGTNFYIKMDTRKGDESPFHSLRGGITKLYYRDTLYCFLPGDIDIVSNRIIYVPENTADTSSALLEAAQKRVDDYLGEGVVTLSYSGGTVAQFLASEHSYYANRIAEFETEIADYEQQIAEQENIIATEEANVPYHNQYVIDEAKSEIERLKSNIESKEWMIESYREEDENLDNRYAFLNNAAGGFTFDLMGPSEDIQCQFIIVKDDEKLSVPTFDSTDVSTDVSASTDSSEVPLDAIIWVDKVTGGKEHDRIHNAIGNTDTEMFDIKIRPGNRKEYISKLKNGKFQVKIPVPDRFNGKNLMVYYVEENGKVNEHIVTVENGYAIFETNHFSIYTLTTVADDVQITPADLNGDGETDASDAIYLLYHVFFPANENYALNGSGDFNSDSSVDAEDAIYLLYSIFFGETKYPLFPERNDDGWTDNY